jgi:hypothetical protein
MANRRMHKERLRLAASKPAEPVVEQPQPINPPVEPQVGNIVQTFNSQKLGRWAGKELNPAQRQMILSELLTRDDVQSVQIFLERVEDPRTSAAALDCLAEAANPPIEMLFQCLRSPSLGQRTAAATALGRLNKPEISRQLIAMVQQGKYRREAMIALLSSSDATARQYLANLERDPMLSATLWNAKRQCQYSLPWRIDYAMPRNPS